MIIYLYFFTERQERKSKEPEGESLYIKVFWHPVMQAFNMFNATANDSSKWRRAEIPRVRKKGVKVHQLAASCGSNSQHQIRYF